MKLNKTILLFIFCAILNNSFLLFGQQEVKSKGFGIEEGAGYNTLYGFDFDPENMQDFWVQPAAKIYYSILFHSFSDSSKFKVPVFIGYYTFGGQGTNNFFFDQPGIYQTTKTNILFHSIEAGFNPCIEKNKFQFGLLIKGQYIFSAKERRYMKGQNPPFWSETDVSIDYKKFAMNTGVKLKYRIINGFSIAVETWFGITNLFTSSSYGDNGKHRLTENNYRFLFGYEF